MRSPLIALGAATVLAAASVLAVGPLVVTAEPAAAATCTAPELVNASVSPRTVVLGTANPKGFVVTVAVRPHGCTVTRVDTDVFTPTGLTNSFSMDKTGTVNGVSTYDVGVRINPGNVENADAGTWRTAVYVTYGRSNTSDDGPTFRVLRAARLSANATPEPVTAGRRVTVHGTLSRANWETLHYAGYTKRPVELQFRARGGSYRTVATATSGTGGTVRAGVRATKDGCYRLVFRGSSTTAKVVSGADCVDVR